MTPFPKDEENLSPEEKTPADNGVCTVADDVLMDVYQQMLASEPGIYEEALNAYEEMLNVEYDQLDESNYKRDVSGVVQRRAPKNPFFRTQPAHERQEKIKDPALQKNPLRGRLMTLLITTSAVCFVFFQSLCYNKTVTGNFHSPESVLGPAPIVLYNLGGMNADRVRRGEAFRLFWAMWMHSGWLHIGFNVICQLQYLFMLEPDWGFPRTSILFFISGVTGNLVSAVCDPCSTTVGSSGALFGLMGGMIPYCLEYWKTIPRPGLILIFSVFVLIVSFLMGFTGTTDNWAHLGGMLGGLLFGLGTIRTLAILEKVKGNVIPLGTARSPLNSAEPNSMKVKRIIGPDGKPRKKVVRRNHLARLFQKTLLPNCRCGVREWTVRLIAWSSLIAVWVGFGVTLFLNYEYTPVGHVTYSSLRSCCCCHDKSIASPSKFTWTCNYCDTKDNRGNTWESVCQKNAVVDNAEKRLTRLMDQVVESSKAPFLQRQLLTSNVLAARETFSIQDLFGLLYTSVEHIASPKVLQKIGDLQHGLPKTMQLPSSLVDQLLKASLELQQAPPQVRANPLVVSSPWDTTYATWESGWRLWLESYKKNEISST